MDLVGYLSSGYPSRAGTLENAEAYIEGGIDVLEIDLPTNNPYIDGELIQHRMKTSYANDSSLKSQVAVIKEIREKHPDQRIFLLAYEVTIKDFGVNEFIDLYQSVNTEAFILVGAEDDQVKNKLQEAGIKIASYVRFHLPAEDLEDAAKANGFVYLQAKPDADQVLEYPTLKGVINHLKNDLNIEVPVYCGVGISTAEDITMVKEAGADGAFVGSGILTREDNKEEQIRYIKELKQAT